MVQLKQISYESVEICIKYKTPLVTETFLLCYVDREKQELLCKIFKAKQARIGK